MVIAMDANLCPVPCDPWVGEAVINEEAAERSSALMDMLAKVYWCAFTYAPPVETCSIDYQRAVALSLRQLHC